MHAELQGRGWQRWQMGGNYHAWGYSPTNDRRENEWVLASGDMAELRTDEPVVIGRYSASHLDGDEPTVMITTTFEDLLAHSAAEWLTRLRAGTVGV